MSGGRPVSYQGLFGRAGRSGAGVRTKVRRSRPDALSAGQDVDHALDTLGADDDDGDELRTAHTPSMPASGASFRGVGAQTCVGHERERGPRRYGRRPLRLRGRSVARDERRGRWVLLET